MATSKPRITVTLEPRAYEVLSRVSAASGETMSSVLANLFAMAVPTFERLVVVLERAKEAPREVKDGMRRALERADATLVPMLLAASRQGDFFFEDLAAEAEPSAAPAPGRVRPGAGAGGGGVSTAKHPPKGGGARPRKGDPRLVTRGSGRDPKQKTKGKPAQKGRGG